MLLCSLGLELELDASYGVVEQSFALVNFVDDAAMASHDP
jgi:hypothetical protein